MSNIFLLIAAWFAMALISGPLIGVILHRLLKDDQ
jgi:hypothetical protein